MKDAYGGILSLVLIAIFLVIVEGILGFLVSYSKAYRMKNFIIESIEEYEGADNCFNVATYTTTSGKKTCLGKIVNHARSIHYSVPDMNCPTDYEKSAELFCYKRQEGEKRGKYYYTIRTQVDINIPIINKIMNLYVFQVHGDTRTLKRWDYEGD